MTTQPIGLSQNLGVQSVMRAHIGEQDLAIWRGESLTVQAWANRCPHRGMRLSYGFVRGDSLACAYHGWHYNCDAQCHYIPAHPTLDPPATIKPKVFSVIEQHGVLWVNTEGEATPVALPESCAGIRTITLSCNLTSAINAFMTTPPQDDSAAKLMAREYSAEPKILSYGLADDSDSVLVLLQQPGAETVNAHILAIDSWSQQGRIKISRWAESVRRQAEHLTHFPTETSPSVTP